MLNSDLNKLHFLGIDLHSRWRRRWLVALTYSIFLVSMAVLVEESKRVPALQSYHSGFWLMLIVAIAFQTFGIFREGGPVKRFNEPVRPFPGMKGGAVILGSLDDRAEYQFGAKFDALAETQQRELLRTYRVGNYLVPGEPSKAPGRLDEREVAEKQRASSKTLVWLTRYCFCLAGIYGFRKMGMPPEDLAAMLLTLGFLAATGPKANILWNEAAPSIEGDLQLVQDPMV
jgi:hypothetical protein